MKNRIIFYIIIGLIGTIILPIILQSGYIFAIDQAFNTNGWIPKVGSNNYWIGWVSQIFVFLDIPIWALEKLIVVMVFTLPIVGVYLYFRKFIDFKSSSALFFALSFSVFNPMLYSRFLDGQINIYVFYALSPLFIYFAKAFFEYRTLKSSLIVGLWSILLVLTTLHAVYFIFFLFFIFSTGYVKKIFRAKEVFRAGTGLIVIICLQFLWLVPLFTSPEDKVFSTVSQIESFDNKQQSAFANIPEDKNIYREILSMRGYWGDYENRFVESHNIFNDDSKNDWIYFIWFIMVIGIIYAYSKRASDRYIFLSLGILGFVLSLGVTNENIFTSINAILYDFLPYYSGFREPQKFVLFLIISYIYFGYFGIIAIGKILGKYKVNKIVATIVLFCCIVSPIAYNFNMLFGFRGQVSVKEYPSEWQDARKYLDTYGCKNCKYNTLIFPWHGYMSISWTNRVVGTWITKYFGENVLYGDTIEIGYIYSSSQRSESKIIEKYIGPKGIFKGTPTKQDYKMFLSDLKDIGIQHIILLKESDYTGYYEILEEIEKQNLLEKVFKNSMISMYKIK